MENLSSETPPVRQAAGRFTPMPWLVRGDIDGFFGLALDNFVQLLLIQNLCRYVLGFPPELLYGRVLPGVAVSLLVGNLFYAWQARQLSAATGRKDICALPYGINTVSLFAHVFFIMLPAKLYALEHHIARPEYFAWHAGLVSTLASGIIECGGAFVAEKIRKSTPRAALLSTLAGIALGFIALGFLFRTFAHPIVGMTTLGIVLLVYFGGVRFKFGIPGGLVAVAIGTILSWQTGIAPATPTPPPFNLSFHLPIPIVGDLLEALQAGHFSMYFSVILPMALFNVIGSLQNIESAEAAGDLFPTEPSLMVNGIGSVAAAFFGSCFPTTIYIGHPGWKAIGARAGYSVLNGVVMTVICLTGILEIIGWAVPIDAGMAIVLWIGIVITAQAFQAVPREHAAAVVIGLLPGVGAWGTLMAKNGLRAAGAVFEPKLIENFKISDTWIHGAFALEQGFIFTSMILAAATVGIIEKRFRIAALWCAIAALLSLTGLIHSYAWLDVAGKPQDVAIALTPAWEWAIGYAVMAAIFFAAPFITEPGEGH